MRENKRHRRNLGHRMVESSLAADRIRLLMMDAKTGKGISREIERFEGGHNRHD